MRLKRHRFAAVAFAAAMLFGGVSASAGAAKPKAKGVKSVYIKTSVIDLATGKPFDMAMLANAKMPTLMFIWAPS